MTLTIANVNGTFSNADNSTYTTTSLSFSTYGGKIIVAVIGNSHASAASIPTLSGGTGVTWTQVISQVQSNGTQRITMFYAFIPNGIANEQVTISFGGITQTSCEWSFVSVTDTPFLGDWPNPIVQSQVGGGSGTATSGLVTLNSAPLTGNKFITGFRHAANESTLQDSTGSWSELHDIFHNLPNAGLITQYSRTGTNDAPDSSGSASWATTSVWVSLGAEIQPSVLAPSKHSMFAIF